MEEKTKERDKRRKGRSGFSTGTGEDLFEGVTFKLSPEW